MKCVCGYEYSDDYDENGEQILIGDEEFLISKFELPYNQYEDIKIETVFICPKCGTLKVDI
jgi:acetone carboxylase gamma subunit